MSTLRLAPVTDSPEQKFHLAEVVTNGAQPSGTTFTVSPLNVGFAQAGTAPVNVNNWEIFDGSLLAVCFKYGDMFVVEGTAVMIGMGLALSAKHVFTDHLQALIGGEAVLYCFGVRPGGLADIWECYAASSDSSGAGDLQLLCLKLVSKFDNGRSFKVMPLVTRVPPPGEMVSVVGFRFDEFIPAETLEDPVKLGGMMYVSKGSAGELSYPIHDSVLAPFPTLEVFSGSLGGMSGGAVLDINNNLLGITSLGLDSNDNQGPTLAAWWMTAVFWRTQLAWPPDVYPDPTAILWDLPTVTILGREYVQLLDEPNFNLTAWEATSGTQS